MSADDLPASEPRVEWTSGVKSLPIEFSAYYSVMPPERRAAAPPALLLALHGYGQACERFLRRFQSLRTRNILVAAPQGPHQYYVSLEPRRVGFSWLTIYERDRSVRDFLAYMRRLLDRLRENHEFEGDRVFLLGFSQGAAMAWRLAGSGVVKPGGMIACGAPDIPADALEMLGRRPAFPTLLVHGESDELVPVRKAHETEAALKGIDFPVEKWFFPGGHDIPLEAANRIGDWIEAGGGA